MKRRSLIVSVLVITLLVCVAVISAVFWISASHDKEKPAIEQLKSNFGTYRFAAVSSNAGICNKIGNDILARYRGNAIDATIATVLCSGILQFPLSGIGGGSFFVIYDKKNGWFTVNSREIAPGAATSKMYFKEEDRKKSLLGGLAIGVPGEIMGLVQIHQKFGSIPWKSVIMPTVKLLDEGFPFLQTAHDAVFHLKNKTGFEDFLDDNQKPKPPGSIIRLPKLARTFQILADDPMSFYNGSLAKDIVKDVQERGGIIDMDDLKNYNVVWKKPTQLKLPGDNTLFSMPAPGSGPILSYILSILSGYKMDVDSVATDEAKILTYHRIIEAMKFAYGKRSALGDEDFVDIRELVHNLTSRSYGEETRLRITDDKTQNVNYYDASFYNVEDSGTSHVSVIDGEGNAVAVTGTLNLYFGSKVIGSRTGIFFNNEMDDFSTPDMTNVFGLPPSESNFIVPGKRPQSSMSPAIVWDDRENRVRLVTGTAGGTRITTTTAWIIMNVLWFNMSLPTATDIPRIHHQLVPQNIVAEEAISPVITSGLEAKGHEIKYRKYMSNSHSILVTPDAIVAVCDYRKGATPDGY